jgi:hypothetical protein
MDDRTILNALERAGLDSSVLLGKTKELLRLLQMKMPIGCLKKAEACRHIIAIEIACRMLKVPFEKIKLTQQAFVHLPVYQEALISCKNVLKLQFDAASVIDVLSVQYGSQLRVQATKFLEDFKLHYVESLDISRQAHIDLTAPAYQAAAFILAAKAKKVHTNIQQFP